VSFYLAVVVDKLNLIEYVSVLKKSLFKAHDDELGILEVFTDHLADVLCVRKVQCGVNLIQDVEWRGLEFKQG
jgi:hypothetical protein